MPSSQSNMQEVWQRATDRRGSRAEPQRRHAAAMEALYYFWTCIDERTRRRWGTRFRLSEADAR
jgi:hypothetical protein